MPRLTALLLALVLGALSAFAVACGEEQREGLIGSNRASDLQDLLDRIDRNTARGGCTAVDENLAALRREIEDLPGSVDRDLRRRLREGLENLEQQAPDECEANEEPETTPETTPETIPTEPTETQPPETTETEPPPPETTETQPPPPETQPTQTTPPPPETQPLPENPGGEEAPPGAIVGGNG